MARTYRIRYTTEPGTWVPPRKGTVRVRPGIRGSADQYGYADDVFLASVMRDADGDVDSVLLMSTDTMGPPSRAMLELVRDAIDHQLEAHTPRG